jgi:hypothetical protein
MNEIQGALDDFKKALSETNRHQGDPLMKTTTSGTTQATNLVWYDLEAPAKNLFPVLTPIVNETLPRVSADGGIQANWKAVTAINSTSLQSFVPEGVRNGVISTTTDQRYATYVRQGLENYVTWEADLASKNFEDVRATQAQRLLWSVKIQEENNVVGANGSAVALGIPTGLVVTPVATGGTIVDNASGYDCYVVALTYMGMQTAAVTLAGVQTLVTVTPAGGGSTFTYGAGSSDKSAKVTSAAVTGSPSSGYASLQMSCTVVTGACGYAWYAVGNGGTALLQGITKTNSFLWKTALTGTQAITAITADNSKNANGFDGLLYQAWLAGSNAYIKALATGTVGTGTALTSSGSGGIAEIDTMLYSMFTNYRLTPDTLWCSAYDMQKQIIPLLFGGTANGTLRQTISLDGGPGGREVVSGVSSVKYLNPFANGVAPTMDIRVHPFMPAGTMLALTSKLPYPINNVSNLYEMKLRRDYFAMEWPQVTAKYETGVYFDGVLAHYFPPSMGIITNIGG